MAQPHEKVNGYYRSTRDYMSDCERHGVPGTSYQTFPLSADHSEPFVAVIPNGRLWGKDGAVLTEKGRLLWDVSREWSADPNHHSIFEQHTLPPMTYSSETVAVINKVGSQNYFHWMYDVIPRIYLLKLSGIHIDRYVVNERPAPFQVETLMKLGIRPEQWIEEHEMFHLQAKTLVVPSLPQEEKWVCDFLRDMFLGEATQTQVPVAGQRIYISRAHCVGRRVLNDPSVSALLEAYGFQVVYPEDMSVAEQINVFANANVIVGPQGAGLSNVTFCQPGTKVIEFMSPSFIIALTEQLCRRAELNYARLTAKSYRNTAFTDPYWSGWDDILVDVPTLARILEQMGVFRM